MAASEIGVDAGGTLIKIAYRPSGEEPIQFRTIPSTNLKEAADWLNERMQGGSSFVCMTGGKAALLKNRLSFPTMQMVEFEATVSGVRWLLKREGMELDSFIMTNVGTGTSVHFVDRSSHYRVGGTGVGGGTLVGLSAMATGIRSFKDIVTLAAAGCRDRIDLTVNHIYEGADPPIPGELTASNFGRWLETGGSAAKEDLLASVVGLVGETVATVSVLAAAQCGASVIIYIGSSFLHNDLLYKVVSDYTKLRGSQALILPNGEFSGAIGAMLAAASKK